MSIGEDNIHWIGSMVDLTKRLTLSYNYLHYIRNEAPEPRILSTLSFNYLKRMK